VAKDKKKKRVFKSTGKKLTGIRCVYRAWKEWEVGDYIIGTYVGSKTDQYEKPNWIFKVEEVGGPSIKALKKLVDQNIGLNSAGNLNSAMVDKNGNEKVVIGTALQITYNGMEEMEGGKYKGKDKHNIDVEVMEDEDGSEAPEEDTEEDDDEQEDADDDDGDTAEDEDEDNEDL